ncbi:MAG: Glu-tRNA(Gln) amidotransferase subunit GatE [candidate division Zixibacteria bacterium]|nr:Glu-tRNA(Gln) amidotransferase subunit GatE [candidate division Zixibacteria bacterium]
MNQPDKAIVDNNDRITDNSEKNYRRTLKQVGFIPRGEATEEKYKQLGFKCGLEIHQQLLTKSKLFCRCPAGIYQRGDDFNAEVIRHMRPTLSEMGEYDGTALMERKTRKNIIYRIKNETACTYEIDDTPPFKIDLEALEIAIEIALLLKTNIVGELHITRKQYLDGSIPTGFQRTAIVGIEGKIPLSKKQVRIIQLSIEEDSCREVSDIRHDRIYTTDRLGMPLIEMVTYPDMLNPDEAGEAGNYLRFLVRSSGKVRTGIGAARQDVNVSIKGGTRVEIKGVAHISWIPDLTHIEAFRQKALLVIKDKLLKRIKDTSNWEIGYSDIDVSIIRGKDIDYKLVDRAVAVNLPGFSGILSHFTQPGKIFADEISDRLKVIACIEKPNLVTSEPLTDSGLSVKNSIWAEIRQRLNSQDGDAQLLFWGPEEDIATALETIEERCRLAFEGVPNETRKSFSDGTTIFERVLPGPNRMYPDTDSAPLSILSETIERIGANLPVEVNKRMEQLREWNIPADCHQWLLRKNLVTLIERINNDFEISQKLLGTILGHRLKYLEGQRKSAGKLDFERLYMLFEFLCQKKILPEFAYEFLADLCVKPNVQFDTLLKSTGFRKFTMDEITGRVPALLKEFKPLNSLLGVNATVHWLMGRLRPYALGNVSLADLRTEVERMVNRG